MIIFYSFRNKFFLVMELLMIIMRYLMFVDFILGFFLDNYLEESNNKFWYKVFFFFDVLIFDMCCFFIVFVFKNG